MIEVILDGNNMNSKERVHIYMQSELNIKEYYGSNLDALWDALSTYSQSIKISLVNKDGLIENLGNYGKSIIKVFQDAEKENNNIKFEII